MIKFFMKVFLGRLQKPNEYQDHRSRPHGFSCEGNVSGNEESCNNLSVTNCERIHLVALVALPQVVLSLQQGLTSLLYLST